VAVHNAKEAKMMILGITGIILGTCAAVIAFFQMMTLRELDRLRKERAGRALSDEAAARDVQPFTLQELTESEAEEQVPEIEDIQEDSSGTEGTTPEGRRIVCIKTASSEEEAEWARGVLKDENIPCYIINERKIISTPYLKKSKPEGLKLLIHEEDSERAARTLFEADCRRAVKTIETQMPEIRLMRKAAGF